MHKDFWNYLYQTFELIDNMDNENQNLLSQVSARLETIELLYARHFDPVDSYEEYVAVKLINAISHAIKRQ
ncbi:hypothetical protein SAMN05216262_108126 [Colwellia chukchiensis]|uniref:Uncharacterized protein n=1 Tax=Colwellia chukchiensis TaxID=641665 RepID=A0A1H7NYH4_9GAMM|nr:hypothetical protein [Colwellia chukchiensis]SEL28436.1 hypothetical protein SAMN05216262_108126 [Colwellia chukchiensis]